MTGLDAAAGTSERMTALEMDGCCARQGFLAGVASAVVMVVGLP